MSNQRITVSIPAYRRIVDAGHTINIQHRRYSYRIQLFHGAEMVASVECSRTGNLSRAGALERARMDAFGPSSSVYKGLQQLAKIAEVNANSVAGA